METKIKGQGGFKVPQIGRHAEAKDRTVYLEELAKEFKHSGLARSFAEGIRNERLTQNVGIGPSMLLSTRRKPIDSAFTRARDSKSSWFGAGQNNVQLSMEADDDLNLWLLDTIRLVGSLGDERNWVIASRVAGSLRTPYLELGLSSEEEVIAVQKASLLDIEVDNDKQVPWTDKVAGYGDDFDPPSLEPVPQQQRAEPKDFGTNTPMTNARNTINTDFLPDLPDQAQIDAILRSSDAGVATGLGIPLIQGDPMSTGSDTPRGRGEGEHKPGDQKDGKASVPPRGLSRLRPARGQSTLAESKRGNANGRQQPRGPPGLEPQSNTGPRAFSDAETKFMVTGHVTDYFFPSENQRNKAAEAKLLKDKEAGSHPAVVFARQYYLNYDKTTLEERQAQPMQQALVRNRSPHSFPNKADEELVALLLERDMLEADRALDPFSDVLLERLREDVLPRWARIRLV
jgi:hypothetical protein